VLYRATWYPRYFEDGQPVPVSFGSISIVWRPLAWAEYRALERIHDPFERALKTYLKVRVEGPGLEEIPFGIAAWIGFREFDQSPFGGDFKTVTQALAQARTSVAADYFQAVRATVSWLFHYKPEELDQLDAATLFERLAQAEYILQKPLNPVDPNAKPAPQGRPRRPNR
jgi:hypothetical protein